MHELEGYQRKHLRGLAHGLDATVRVGKSGLSPGLFSSVEESLAAHELIKIRFVEHKAERHELAAEIARRTESHLAGIVGHVAILYRPHGELARRRIQLPDRGA